jgi:hypothetical protein
MHKGKIQNIYAVDIALLESLLQTTPNLAMGIGALALIGRICSQGCNDEYCL